MLVLCKKIFLFPPLSLCSPAQLSFSILFSFFFLDPAQTSLFLPLSLLSLFSAQPASVPVCCAGPSRLPPLFLTAKPAPLVRASPSSSRSPPPPCCTRRRTPVSPRLLASHSTRACLECAPSLPPVPPPRHPSSLPFLLNQDLLLECY